MENIGTHKIEKIIASLLPDRVIRQKCLVAFSEAIRQANQYGKGKWGVHYEKDAVRLLVGNIIVCTIHKNVVWLALDQEQLNIFNEKSHLLEVSDSWQWDTDDYPKYSQVPSKNGYYKPTKDEMNIWPVIKDFHFEFIRKVAGKYQQLKKTSQSKYKPEVLIYLRRELGQPIPRPSYDTEFYEEDSTNPLQEIETYQFSYENLPETEREAIVQSRVGQGKFRSNLIKYWAGCCAVTGCTVTTVLKASHIKPWRDSSNLERLDLYNGLLLTPNLDSAFDNGFISFDDDGKIIVSNLLEDEDKAKLSIRPEGCLRRLEEQHLKYLEYHRKNVFK